MEEGCLKRPTISRNQCIPSGRKNLMEAKDPYKRYQLGRIKASSCYTYVKPGIYQKSKSSF